MGRKPKARTFLHPDSTSAAPLESVDDFTDDDDRLPFDPKCRSLLADVAVTLPRRLKRSQQLKGKDQGSCKRAKIQRGEIREWCDVIDKVQDKKGQPLFSPIRKTVAALRTTLDEPTSAVWTPTIQAIIQLDVARTEAVAHDLKVESQESPNKDKSLVDTNAAQSTERLGALASSLIADCRISKVLLPILSSLEQAQEPALEPREEVVALEARQAEADGKHKVALDAVQDKLHKVSGKLRDLEAEATRLREALRLVEAKITTSKEEATSLKTEAMAMKNAHSTATEEDRLLIQQAHVTRNTAGRDKRLAGQLQQCLRRCTEGRSALVPEAIEAALGSQVAMLQAADNEVNHIQNTLAGLKDNPDLNPVATKITTFLHALLGESATKAVSVLESLKMIKGHLTRQQHGGAMPARLGACLALCRRLRAAGPAQAPEPYKGARRAVAVALCPTSCDRHLVPGGHPETPARTISLREGLQVLGMELQGALEIRYDVQPVKLSTVRLVHAGGYVDAVLRSCAQRATSRTWRLYGDIDTYISRTSEEAILCASGAVCRAVDIAVAGQRVFCCIRPPGHHVGRWGAPSGADSQGFCIFNNICIGAAHARISYPWLHRIVVLEIDPAYGNGTEEILQGDEESLFVSIHTKRPSKRGLLDADHPSGASSEEQAQPGVVKVQVAPECSAEELLAAVQKQVVPALKAFAPQLMLLSVAGWPSWSTTKGAPEGRLASTTQCILGCLPEECPVVSALEGGYSHGNLCLAKMDLDPGAIGVDTTEAQGQELQPAQNTELVVQHVRALARFGASH